MKKLLPLGLTALAGTVAAGVIATQAPSLADRGEEVVLRDDQTPSVTQVDDDDDDDTLDRDRNTKGVASRVSLKDASRSAAPRVDKDVSRDAVSRQSRASRQVDSRQVASRQSVASRNTAPAPRPAPDVSRDSVDAPSRASAVSRDSVG